MLLSGCSSSPDGNGSSDASKTLVYGASLAQEQIWDPQVASLGLEAVTNLALYDTLVAYEGKDLTTIVPSLATDWTVDSTGSKYEFTLDPNATFNSGNSVTPDDVVFSFMRLKNLASPVSYLAESFASVEATGPSTVAITLTAPNVAFLRLLVDVHFVVMEAAVVKANGGTDAADASEKDTATAWLNENSAGSGPYQIESASPGDQLVMVANPNAWRPADYFERVIIQNTASGSSQAAAVQQGDIDITQVIAPAIIASIPSNASVKPYGSPGMVWYLMGMNRDAAQNPAMANQDVQRAIHLALDYDGIHAMGPDLAPWYGMVPDYVIGGVTKAQAVTQNVAEAKSLLAGAGYADGFEVSMCTSTSSLQQPSMLDYAQKIQSDLDAVGIKVQINAQDGSAFLTKYRAAECQMVVTVDGPAIADPSHLADFLPNGPRGKRMGWVDGNLGTDGQKYLDLAAKANSETDEDVRAALWNEIAAGIAQDGPWISIGSISFQFLANSNIKGLDEYAMGLVFDPARLSR